MPVAYIMGVSWDDSFKVAELLGIKTFVNEFVAYEQLAKLIKNRRQMLPGDKLSVSQFLIIIESSRMIRVIIFRTNLSQDPFKFFISARLCLF